MVPGKLFRFHRFEDCISDSLGYPFPEEQINIQSVQRPACQARTFIEKVQICLNAVSAAFLFLPLLRRGRDIR